MSGRDPIGGRWMRVAGLSVGAGVVLALGLAGPVMAGSTGREPAGDGRLLDVLVDLRLGRVLDAVLDEPDRDPMQRAEYRVRLARADLVAATGDAAERRALIEALFLRSSELIDEFSDHPLAAGWRLDRAEDVWRWLWPQEAAGVQVMLGVPDEAAEARVDRAVRLMHVDVPAAAAGLDAAIERLEFAPGWPDDPALIREHRRLVEEERDGRLPVVRAIAEALAVMRPAPGQTPSPAEIDRVVAGLRGVAARFAAPSPPASGPDGAAAARATIEQLTGFVLLAGRRFDEAIAGLQAAAESARTGNDAFNASVSTMAVTAARIAGAAGVADARAAIDRLTARATAVAPGAGPTFTELLAADVAFRAAAGRAREASGRAGETPRGLFEAGLRGWTELARTDRRWFAVVRDRFARALRPGDPVGTLPPVGRLGWSDALRASGQGAAAIELLAELATDERSTSPADRAEAWRSLGQTAAERGQVAGAAWATLAAAVVEPDSDRSSALVDAALRLAAAVEPRDSRDGGAAEDPAPRVLPTAVDRWPAGADPAVESDGLIAGLAFASRRHPELPGLDRWRSIGAGRLIAAGRTAEATRLLAEVSPDAAEAPAALATGLQLARTRLRDGLAESDASPASIAAAANAVLERLRDAEAAVAAGKDVDGRLAARMADGRGAVMAAEALLAVGRPADAMGRLGLGTGARAEAIPDGQDVAPHEPSAITSVDPAIRDAAGDLAARAILAQLPNRPDRGARDRTAPAGLADSVAKAALHSRRAARTLVVELGRRITLLEAAAGPEPAAGAAAEAFVGPLAHGLATWLRTAEPVPPASDGDAAADRAVRALAFRDVGRAELAAGRAAAATAWFEALGGLESADPAVLLGAAEARYRTAAAAAVTGATVNEADLVAAMGAYRRLAGDRATAGEGRWWIAQLRMVQILDLTGRRTETIAPRIERLRLGDPTLGGPAFEAAFAMISTRHAPPGGASRPD